MSVRPSSRSRNTPLPGSKWSGVQVQYTMQSRSEGWSEARASAFRVAARASRAGDGEAGGYVLHLTYEEATALNELCAWNVHTDPSGAVTPESRVFDDLVKAILTHPDY